MARSSVAIFRGGRAGRKHRRPPPNLVLASEALKEDLAPLEPGRGAGRLGICGLALALGLLAVSLRLGVCRCSLPLDSSIVVLGAAGAALAVAALPFSYSIRALAAAALGLALIALGADGRGPLVIARSLSDSARLVVLLFLPG